MSDKPDPLYDRTGKFQFRDAAREVLGQRDTMLVREWDDMPDAVVFGEFLHKHHPDIFAQLVAWMKINGKW
jgi:hypothetical protein